MRIEVDTGASRSIMSESKLTSIYAPRKAPALHPISTDLRTYTKEVVPVVGSANVIVGYGKSTHVLQLLIVHGEGPTLFGRDWLRIIRLNWSDVNRVSNSGAGYDTVLNKYPGLFSDGVGTFVGPKVRIHVSADAQPLFHKARPVPYMMLSMLKCELDCLQSKGIISAVEYSDWTAPIVPTLKADGTVRICGDYKTTINRYSKLDGFVQSRGSVHHSHGWPVIH